MSIKANDWFVPIEKAYPELETEYRRLELQKYLSTEARNAAFASLILLWGHQRYPYMTVLCDHEYLAGVREKIKLIQAFTLQTSAA